MKKWFLIILGVLALGAGIAALVGWFMISDWASTPMPGSGEQVAVDIPRGSGPKAVAALLAEHRVIADAGDFYDWVRWVERSAGDVKAGELAFRGDMTPRQVLRVLVDGTPITHKITFPEGLRIDEVGALFEIAGLADAGEFEKRARDEKFVRSLGVPHDSLEGFLFPETYQFPKHAELDTILETLVGGYKRTFTEEWRRRAAKIGMSELQVVTLASIIEKETGAAHERAMISGVFHNRLRQNWKLQTDPTVIYAEILASGKFDGTIHRSDLERNHPYNTYRRKGLPPGPICSAGAAALEAALYSTRTNNMYFVSKNDGTHQFCPDLACHNHWVARYQR